MDFIASIVKKWGKKEEAVPEEWDNLGGEGGVVNTAGGCGSGCGGDCGGNCGGFGGGCGSGCGGGCRGAGEE